MTHMPLPARVGEFSTLEVAFLIGVPLLWGILLLFHPGGEGTVVTYRSCRTR